MLEFVVMVQRSVCVLIDKSFGIGSENLFV